MRFALVLLCTVVFCFVCKGAIKKVPWLFYLLALIISAMYALTGAVSYPFALQQALFFLMQKGTLATAVFVVVMYIGVFPDNNYVQQRLKPIRAPLSIIACILILGHVVKYLTGYLPRFFDLNSSLQGSLILAIVLFVLMLVLGVTSFQVVKHKMSASSWIKLQKTAYLFYALLYVHVMIILLPPAMHGSQIAMQSVAVYSVVFILYAILRIGKAVHDNKAKRV